MPTEHSQSTDATLPEIPAEMSVVKPLAQKLSTQGDFPGYAPTDDGFVFDAFGVAFDHQVTAAAGGDGTVTLSMAPKKKVPLIFGLLFAVSIYPGLPFTHDLISTYSDWYASHVQTWWWYLPLMAVSAVPIPKKWRDSKAAAVVHAHEKIELLRSKLPG